MKTTSRIASVDITTDNHFSPHEVRTAEYLCLKG